MLAFSIDYYGMIFRATQSVELFCAYDFAALQAINPDIVVLLRIPGVLKYPVVRGKDVVFRLPERTGLLGS